MMQILEEIEEKAVRMRKYRRKSAIDNIEHLNIPEWTEFVDIEKQVCCELPQELKKINKRIRED
jgi:hypothetical protein